MDDDRIDRAIDDAARAMTAREPEAAFRANVLARLERRRSSRTIWIVSPIAAVVSIVAVVVVWQIDRGPGGRDPASGKDGPGAQQRSAVSPGRPAPQQGAVSTSVQQPVTGDRSGRLPRPAHARIRRSQPASAVAALAPPPLDVSSIALTQITHGDPLDIPELEPIAPITVEPIGEPEGDRP